MTKNYKIQFDNIVKCCNCCIPKGYPNVSFVNKNNTLLCEECYKLKHSSFNRNNLTKEARIFISKIKNNDKRY